MRYIEAVLSQSTDGALSASSMSRWNWAAHVHAFHFECVALVLKAFKSGSLTFAQESLRISERRSVRVATATSVVHVPLPVLCAPRFLSQELSRDTTCVSAASVYNGRK